jgi:outer membrane murein-binding lipoprotein Lpp
MKSKLLPVLVAMSLAACATARMSEPQRLALYMQHAGEPVKQIRYHDPMGWNRIDDEHVVLDIRPGESWLLTVSGPCLDWGSASPTLSFSSLSGAFITAKIDQIATQGSPMSCRIEEIRPLDMKAVRAAQDAINARAQASGT